MSNNTEEPAVESEILFDTEGLLAVNTEDENESNNNVEMSEDLDFNQAVEEELEKNDEGSDDLEAMEEGLETIEEGLETIEEESEMVDETEDLLENDETEETLEETPDGEVVTAKPASKAPALPRTSELPLSKIKHIIKLDPEVHLVNSEAVLLITKATELFIKTLAKESYNFATQQKKKTLTKLHVDHAFTMLPIDFMN